MTAGLQFALGEDTGANKEDTGANAKRMIY
jgi:hypothetical protein